MAEINYAWIIGKKVCKKSNKPFKSGSKVNTVTGVVEHPQLQIPAFTFAEDESVVECRQCMVVVDTPFLIAQQEISSEQFYANDK